MSEQMCGGCRYQADGCPIVAPPPYRKRWCSEWRDKKDSADPRHRNLVDLKDLHIQYEALPAGHEG